MIRNDRLADAEALDELPDGELPLPREEVEEAQPRRVAQGAEVLGDKVCLLRRGRTPKWSWSQGYCFLFQFNYL